MTKEILTKENIQKDVLAYVKRRPSPIYTYFLDILLTSIILVIIFAVFVSWKHALVFLILPIFALLGFAPRMREEARERKAALQGEYTVIKDKLSHVDEETIHEPRSAGGHRQTIQSARFLYFPSGQWRITSPNYTWSKTFYMSGQGIENTSLVGDEFYLVILHSTQEICAVYNTKFFVYGG